MQWCAWRLANVYSKTLSCIWITVVTKGYEFIYSFGKCLLKHPLWVKPWRFKNEPYCLLSWTSIPSLLPWALCLANFHSSFRTQILPPPRCLPHSSHVLVTPCTFTFMALSLSGLLYSSLFIHTALHLWDESHLVTWVSSESCSEGANFHGVLRWLKCLAKRVMGKGAVPGENANRLMSFLSRVQ